jgi:hypothetical protein
MNKVQENKRTMYEAVLALLSANSAKTAAVAAFATSEAEFRNIVSQIENKSAEYNQATVGRTASKNQAADILVDAVLPMAAALFAYGSKQKDATLKEKAAVNESELRRIRDTELITQTNAILALLNEHLLPLADYGVTAAKITEFQQKITDFNAALGTRESSLAERVGARTSLADLIRKADEILHEQLDHFMELFRPTEPQFYTEYFTARIIKDLGTRHRRPATDAPPTAGTPAPTGAPMHA